MKIGILGWDYGEVDKDSPVIQQVGRDIGHDVTLFTLDDIGFAGRRAGGMDLLFRGERAADFDAVLSRAQVRDDRWQMDLDLLDLASHVPGVPILDPAVVWLAAESKLGMMQRLGDAGFPVPPTWTCRTPQEVEASWHEWGPIVIKPIHGYGGYDVKRILDDLPGALPAVEATLAKFGTMVCQPYFHAPEGDIRVTVIGGDPMMRARRIPSPDGWKANTPQGAVVVAFEPPKDVVDMAVQASAVMGVSVAGCDILWTENDGFKLMEVNTVPGGLWLLGEDLRREMMIAMFRMAEQAAEAEAARRGAAV